MSTLYKLFTSMFDEAMFAHGFKRKGTLYYRLNGNILQGLILTNTSPYFVRYNMMPYWVYGSECRFGTLDAESLKLGGWAEEKTDGYTGVVFNKNDPKPTIENLQSIYSNFFNIVMPTLDMAKDELTYFSAMFHLGREYGIYQKAVLYLSYQQNDMALADFFMKYRMMKTKMRCYRNALDHYTSRIIMKKSPMFNSIENLDPNVSYPEDAFTSPAKSQEFVRSYTYGRKLYFDVLEEKATKSDLYWIKEVHDADCVRIAKMLKEALDIDVNV